MIDKSKNRSLPDRIQQKTNNSYFSACLIDQNLEITVLYENKSYLFKEDMLQKQMTAHNGTFIYSCLYYHYIYHGTYYHKKIKLLETLGRYEKDFQNYYSTIQDHPKDHFIFHPNPTLKVNKLETSPNPKTIYSLLYPCSNKYRKLCSNIP